MSTNGSGNGRDKNKDKDKVVSFPSLAERDRMKREERKQEEQWRKDYQAQQKAARKAQNPPMFNFGNIPPFAKFMTLTILSVHILLYVILGSDDVLKAIYTFGFLPGTFTGTSQIALTPVALITPFTHMLIHGSWMHLFFNIVMGLALGMMFERQYGTRATAIFFTLCGLGGALIYFALNPFTTTPVIGASGAISGLFAATLMLMLQQNPYSPIAQKLGKKGPWPMLIGWGAIMVVLGLLGGGDMAWQAHVGGYVTGIILHLLMLKGKLRL